MDERSYGLRSHESLGVLSTKSTKQPNLKFQAIVERRTL